MKHFLSLILIAVTLFSCSEDSVTPPDNTVILTDGVWQKTAVTFDKIVNIDVSGIDTEKAYMDEIESCLTDETFDFQTNLKVYIDNSNPCAPNEQTIFNCNWTKINNNSFVFDDYCGGQTYTYKSIIIQNENTAYLIMESVFEQFPFDPLTLNYTWTLKKQ